MVCNANCDFIVKFLVSGPVVVWWRLNIVKRLFDICFSIACLAPAFLIVLCAAFLVFVVERHNPFFTQIRLGKDEKPFRILKIRTMQPSTLSVATHDAPEFAITRTGHWFRRLKIDELPQLINVILGQMSLVGPRPGLPQQTELLDARRQLKVFGALPGLTGLGQVLGVDMSEPQRLAEIDANYISTQNLRNDFQILAKTFVHLKSNRR